MNTQPAGPLSIAPNTDTRDPLPLLVASDYPGQGIIAYLNPHRLNANEAHRLVLASYSAFDSAGRALGIDASLLAESIDLAGLIGALNGLLDAFVHIPDDEKGNKARTAIFTHCVNMRKATTKARDVLANLPKPQSV